MQRIKYLPQSFIYKEIYLYKHVCERMCYSAQFDDDRW